MEEHFKRPNKLTGEPYVSGFTDEDGRVFIRYLNKQGNDGFILKSGQKIKIPIFKKLINLN